MTKLTRYGLVGCGMMGREHIRNLGLLKDVAVTAIFEPDAEMRARAAALAPGARFAESLDDLLGADDLDALVIASPNHCHAQQLARIAETRPLPLMIEKPVLSDAADIPHITAVAAAYPAPLWVAMEYRYMPPIADFLQHAEDVTGGIRMLTIREHRFPFLRKVGDWNRFNAQTGGTFVEKCCHFFDLMRLVLRDEPVRVMASAGQAVNHLDESYGGRVPDILDHGYVIVDFARGARAMLELCMFAEGARYQEAIAAIGPAGKIEAFVPGPTRFWPANLGDAPTPFLEISPRAPKGPRVLEIPVDPVLLAAGDHNGSTFYQHQRFLELLRGKGGQPEVTFTDGLRAIEMGMAAQTSAATGKAIAL